MTAAQAEYQRYLRTVRWRCISRWRRWWDVSCRVCGESHGLEAHHSRYRWRGRLWLVGWALEWHDVITLCDECHDRIHKGRSIKEFA